MQFSEVFCDGGTPSLNAVQTRSTGVKLSPDGTMICLASQSVVEIRDVDAVNILHEFMVDLNEPSLASVPGIVDKKPTKGAHVGISAGTNSKSNPSMNKKTQAAISQLQWSPDSSCVLATVNGNASMYVLDVKKGSMRKFQLGACGLVHADWSPDSCHVLAHCDFGLGMMIWSLMLNTVYRLPYAGNFVVQENLATAAATKGSVSASAKSMASTFAGAQRGFYSFSPDDLFLAVAERVDAKDQVSIYTYSSEYSWSKCISFQTETNDVYGLSWSPDQSLIAVWDSPTKFHLLLYSPDGAKINEYSAYEQALGISDVKWSPDGKLIAVASYDMVLRILNVMTWKLISELAHPTEIEIPTDFVVYREIKSSIKRQVDDPSTAQNFMKSYVPGQPVSLAKFSESLSTNYEESVYITEVMEDGMPTTPAADHMIEDMGVSLLSLVSYTVSRSRSTATIRQQDLDNPAVLRHIEWSHRGDLICSVSSEIPNVIWIWDVRMLRPVSVLIQQSDVYSMTWNIPGAVEHFNSTPPGYEDQLTISTGSKALYFWTRSGASIVNLPFSDLPVRCIQRSDDGKVSLLASLKPGGKFVMMFC